MALYAFDGTWNEDEADEAKEANAPQFSKSFPEGMPVVYQEGGWARLESIGKLLGGAMGAGVAASRKSCLDFLSCVCATSKIVVGSVGFDFCPQRN